jgi:hypothetical protein
MTRKDFEFIAETLKDVRPASVAYTDTLEQWKRTVRTFAARLKGTNPRFDAIRFAKAAGIVEGI